MLQPAADPGARRTARSGARAGAHRAPRCAGEPAFPGVFSRGLWGGGWPGVRSGAGQPASLAACAPAAAAWFLAVTAVRPAAASAAAAAAASAAGVRCGLPRAWRRGRRAGVLLRARPVTPIARSLPSEAGAQLGRGEDTGLQGFTQAETAEGKVRVGAGGEQRTPPCPGTGLPARRRALAGDSETWPASPGVHRAQLPREEKGVKFLPLCKAGSVLSRKWLCSQGRIRESSHRGPESPIACRLGGMVSQTPEMTFVRRKLAGRREGCGVR